MLIEEALRKSYPANNYVWLTDKGMVGLYICLIIKSTLIGRISDLHLSKIKTGIWGSSGNKGAVIMRFNLDDTSMILMNCHLMSGKNKSRQRTEEINFIFDNMFKEDYPSSKSVRTYKRFYI